MSTYTPGFRIWRGDAEGGGPAGLRRRGERRRGRAGHRPPAPGHPGLRPRGALELQGRQVRFVQRGGQRAAAADVHDAHVDLRAGRDDHGHPAAGLPGRPRPGHRRVLQLRRRRARSRPSCRRRGWPPGEYRMQQIDVERSQEFRKCIECFLCQDTCHVVRDHEENKGAFAGPRFLMRVAELDMHPLDAAAEAGLDRAQSAQEEHGLGLLQHHQVLHGGLPGGHQDHRQRADPAEGAGGGPQVRPAGVAGHQDRPPARPRSPPARRPRPSGRMRRPSGGPRPARPSVRWTGSSAVQQPDRRRARTTASAWSRDAISRAYAPRKEPRGGPWRVTPGGSAVPHRRRRTGRAALAAGCSRSAAGARPGRRPASADDPVTLSQHGPDHRPGGRPGRPAGRRRPPRSTSCTPTGGSSSSSPTSATSPALPPQSWADATAGTQRPRPERRPAGRGDRRPAVRLFGRRRLRFHRAAARPTVARPPSSPP